MLVCVKLKHYISVAQLNGVIHVKFSKFLKYNYVVL